MYESFSLPDEHLGDDYPLWQHVVARDPAADGSFVYGVQSTGVYCRPSCKSRRPKRENVQFFQLPAAAEAAGFRACKRCRPNTVAMQDSQVALVQAICDHINTHLTEPDLLSLEALSAAFHFDPHHLQDVFKRVLGLTPRQYADAQRLKLLKVNLRETDNVADAIHSAGYGSSSRVYERADTHLGMTPATYQQKGQGMHIQYTVIETYLGQMLIGATERGICAITLHATEEEAVTALHEEYPRATLTREDTTLQTWVAAIMAHVEGRLPHLDLPLDIQATAFQWKVWGALQQIPRGETRSYAQIAEAIGQPEAVRAVASAIGSNRAAIVIPCHRVIGKDGKLTGYRWGIERKRILLEQEEAIPVSLPL